MPKLLTSKKILRGSVSFGDRTFGKKSSKARETRIFCTFPVASVAGTPHPFSFPHNLGFTPSHYTVVSRRIDQAIGTPGQVWDIWPWATPTHVTFYCSVAGTVAEIVLR